MEHTLWQSLSQDKLLTWLETITAHHRIKGGPELETLLERLACTLDRVDNLSVTLHRFASSTCYGTWRAPRNWRLGNAQAELLLPNGSLPVITGQEKYFGICDYSMPPKAPLDIVADTNQPMQNKAILVRDASRLDMMRLVHKHKAAGILIAPSGKTPPDARKWHRLPLTGHERDIPFALSLTRDQGDLIAANTGSLQIQLDLDAGFCPGCLPVLQLTTPSHPVKEYIVVTAHICHPKPCANDNASGCAAVLELACRYADILAKKPSTRGIIFLLVPEVLGTQAWLLSDAAKGLHITNGLNLDMVACNMENCDTRLHIVRPPFFMHSLMPWLAKHYLTQSAEFTGKHLPVNMRAFSIGSDHHALVFPGADIPSISLGCWPDPYYHTNKDTIDRLSLDVLQQVTWTAGMVLSHLLYDRSRELAHILPQLPSSAQERRWLYQDSAGYPAPWRAALKPKPGPLPTWPRHPKDTLTPKRLYQGPISRKAVFERSQGKAVSQLERLSSSDAFLMLNNISVAEMLLNGKNSIHDIITTLVQNGLTDNPQALQEQLLLTLDQLVSWDFIAF